MPGYLRSTVIVGLSLTLATLLTFPLQALTVHSLALLFMAAVVVTSRFAGDSAGLFTAIVSVLIFDWFFDRRPYHFDFGMPGDTLRGIVFCSVSFLVASLERQRRRAINALEAANRSLRAALDEVKTLRGLLPICMHCKQIRTDTGLWVQIENYLRQHSEAEFTHGLCPSCFRTHYPETYEKYYKGD
jgi:K+-sensing histidine kinase KdpD